MRNHTAHFLTAVPGLFLLSASVFAQAGPVVGVSPAGVRLAGDVTAQQSVQGSVPSGASTGEPLPLSLDDALQRGLRYNLGAINSQQSVRQAQGQRIVALSQLMPNLTSNLREVDQQIDLAALGFKFNVPPSVGFTIPNIVGPFNYFDLRGFLTQKLADVQALRTYQSSIETRRAADFSVQDAREMVVYVVTEAYLQVIADAARVSSAQAQVDAAQAIYQQAADRFAAGLSARINMTRSDVELQTQQQRLTAEQAGYAKQKIVLGRLIGLPAAQDVVLTDVLVYAPLDNLSLEQAIGLASEDRSDLKAAEAQMRAAELSRKAAVAERYPTVDIAADYGVIGNTPASSHGTFSVTGALRFPIWAGGQARGDIMQADAAYQQEKANYENLRVQVEAEVRTAFLDLTAAAEQVRVAQSRRALAQDELKQSSDRFASGIADTVEVVQAQEAVSSAEEAYIASLNAHNLAKAGVARAAGQAEKITRSLMRSQ